jgi:hypothetical protein
VRQLDPSVRCASWSGLRLSIAGIGSHRVCCANINRVVRHRGLGLGLGELQGSSSLRAGVVKRPRPASEAREPLASCRPCSGVPLVVGKGPLVTVGLVGRGDHELADDRAPTASSPAKPVAPVTKVGRSVQNLGSIARSATAPCPDSTAR